MNLSSFTRRLEECRKRWHHNTVRYVVAVARIVRAARRAAKDERRWGEWIRNETHMNRTTVYRYLRVAEFLKANVSLKQHLASLSIAKLYALSRLKHDQAIRLIRSGRAASMNDVAFLRLASRLHPTPMTRSIRPNLVRSLESAMGRLELVVRRWEHSHVTLPVALQSKLQARLQAINRAVDRRRRTSAAAM
jgi:hypothetical protein